MNEIITFKILTLGCKVNACESAAIEKSLLENGFSAAEGENADLFVINSCSVTGTAVAKARHAASRFRRENPAGIIALCGCFPQSYPEEAGLKFDADIVLGNSDKDKLADYARDYIENRVKTVKVNPLSREFCKNGAAPDEDRTRAFIKIEDGCDRFCSYCIIPTARGRVRSLSREDIAKQAQSCFENGHKEIVLTGINLGCYGQELGLSLYDAVKAVSESGVPRIRLSSLEPEMMTDELIEKLGEIPALCPHFHLSLQSGSDDILRKMNRKYSAEQYSHIVEKLRGVFPECSITTDIIVGFPYESDEDFRKSVDFAKKIGFAKIHVFPYSIRKGTIAAEMPQVQPSVRTERSRVLIAEAERLEDAFLRSQRGKTGIALIEKPQSELYSQGFTENYTPVRILNEQIPRHTLVKVEIIGAKKGYCIGRILQK